MGNRSNTRNGLFFERLSPRGEVALYRVVILEGKAEIGTVRREDDGNWAAIGNDGEVRGYLKDRQKAGESLRSDTPEKTVFASLFSTTPSTPAAPTPVAGTPAPQPRTPEKPKKTKKTATKAPSTKAKLKKDQPKKEPEVRRPISWKSKGSGKGFEPVLKVVGPEPITDHPPKVSWNGKGDRSMFPSSVRGSAKKNQRFACDEQYVNGDDDLTYILVYGEEKYFEVSAQYFRVLKG